MRRLPTSSFETEDNYTPLFQFDQSVTRNSIVNSPEFVKPTNGRIGRTMKSKIISLTPLDVPSDSNRITSPTNEETPRSLATPPINNSCPGITQKAFVDSIVSRPNWDRDTVIVDCRWDYEYNAGHIRGAVHYQDAQKLVEDMLVKKLFAQHQVIFYCEYSAVRSVRMAQYFRSMNMEARFPFDNIQILENGYHSFYPKYTEYCVGDYVSEKDERYYDENRDHRMNIPEPEPETLLGQSWALLP